MNKKKKGSQDANKKSKDANLAKGGRNEKSKMGVMVIRTLLLVVGLVYFIRFFIPIPLKGVHNIGNATGMGVSLVLFLYGLFFHRINHLLSNFWKLVPGKILMVLAGLAIVTILVLVIIESVCMIRATQKKVPDETATVVVLGCKVHANRPSEMLYTRLEATLAYLKEHPEAKVVLSGGQGADEPISEAQGMYDYLIARGVDPNRLYLEDQSTNTKENLKYSMAVIRENDLNETIVIISNEFHLYRACRLASLYGYHYGCYAANTPGWAMPTFYVRELYGILRDWVISE